MKRLILCRGILVFFVSACSSSPSSSPTAPEPPISLPKEESAFIQAVESVKGEYNFAPNELKKSLIRTKRGTLIRSSLGDSRNISEWIGKTTKMATTSEGKAILEIQLEGTDIKVKTWNNGLSDIFDNTLIPQQTDLYSSISEMNEGTREYVST